MTVLFYTWKEFAESHNGIENDKEIRVESQMVQKDLFIRNVPIGPVFVHSKGHGEIHYGALVFPFYIIKEILVE